MAKYPERYEPGELDRTRQNLGPLTQDEMKKMANKLGGEIGVEKNSSLLLSQYKEMQEKNWARGNELVDGPVSRGETSTRRKERGKINKPKGPSLPKMKWWDRVRLDFYCAQPDVGVKTLSQALACLVPFLGRVEDHVSRHYVLGMDHYMTRGIENLVLAVRGLTAKSNKNALQSIRRVPLYNDILKLIRGWDIEGINNELTVLQRKPSGHSFTDFVPLVKLVLRPFYLLSKLSLPGHILPALQKMYDLDRTYMVNPVEREKVQKYYIIAREELPEVFGNLRKRIFPFLAKLLGTKYLPRETFFVQMEKAIWNFLSLTEADFLKDIPAPAPLAPEILDPASPPSSEEGACVDEETGEPCMENPEPFPSLAQKGLDFLDRMFPRAGWKNLETSPDLSSYFHPILSYPKGSVLLSPQDPLHPAQTLSLILQNLFYGFHALRFGQMKNQFGETIPLQNHVEKAISSWHFFMEEFFTKNYLPQLTELTRVAERQGIAGSESKKIAHQLLWYKRNWLLPHLRVPVLENVRVKNLGHPVFSQQLKTFLELLAPVSVEVELAFQKAGVGAKVQTVTLENPLDPIQVSIENIVSQRLSLVLQKTTTGGAINRNLLYAVLSLMEALDHLVNQPKSLLYVKDSTIPFRTIEGTRDAPLLSPPKKDTLGFLKTLTSKEKETRSGLVAEDGRKELFGPYIAREELKKQVQNFHQNETPFSVVALKHLGLAGLSRSAVQYRLEELHALVEARRLPSQTLTTLEDDILLLIFPGTESDEAESAAHRILQDAASREPSALPVAALVIPFQKLWSMEKFLGLPARGFQLGRDYPPQVLGVFLPERQTFEFREDLPVVSSGGKDLDETALPDDEDEFLEEL